MLILLPFLAVAVLAYLWISRRGSTLTRTCQWRHSRAANIWTCAACGATCQPARGAPRQCLRPPSAQPPKT